MFIRYDAVRSNERRRLETLNVARYDAVCGPTGERLEWNDDDDDDGS